MTKGIPKGVEFAGGTVVIEQFEQPVTDQQVRSALERTFGQNIIINATGDPSQRLMMIRVPQVGAESGRIAEPKPRSRWKRRCARRTWAISSVKGPKSSARRSGGS